MVTSFTSVALLPPSLLLVDFFFFFLVVIDIGMISSSSSSSTRDINDAFFEGSLAPAEMDEIEEAAVAISTEEVETDIDDEA